MKIIHTADLHLDSKLDANFADEPERKKQRREETLVAFTRLADYAAQNDVKVVIIAGDMFDTNSVINRVVNTVLNTIRKYPDIDFLYLRGNHDEKSIFVDAATKPENLKLFNKDEWTEYQYDNISIWGTESLADREKYASFVPDRSRFNIVTLHGQTGLHKKNNDKSDVIALNSFKNLGLDYIALGHIHSFIKEKLDDRCDYCYAGCLEGRGFDECGVKGFCLLDINGDKYTHEFIPFAKREFHYVEVDITETIYQDDIADLIREKIKDIPAKDMILVDLVGYHTVETEINIPFFTELLGGSYFLFKIKCHSKPLINVEDYKGNISLKGEFLNLVEESDLSDEDKKKVMLLGIQALSGVKVGELSI